MYFIRLILYPFNNNGVNLEVEATTFSVSESVVKKRLTEFLIGNSVKGVWRMP